MERELHGDSPTEERDGSPESSPRIYVASLSDYNAGILHGAWLNAATEPEDVNSRIESMLAKSPTTRRTGEPAEEWAVHDYEGFGPLRLGEYVDVVSLTSLARGIAEHGLAFAAFKSLSDANEGEDEAQAFIERFCGEWSSVEAYAEELLDELGATAVLDTLPDWLQPYLHLDTAAFARDLEYGGDITTVPTDTGTLWVFRGT